ncbi:hypothetical protein SFUMM280S_02573 [Streptomyces fumanus]
MSLITNVMDHSLDDGYAEAAARKKAADAGGLPGPCGPGSAWPSGWCSPRSW